MPVIRFASDRDLDRLADVEDDADRLLVEHLRPDEWDRAANGRARAERPGFLLVAAETDDGEPVGFAHVLEEDGAHLEQLAVRRSHGRLGIGTALVRAAAAEAARRGHSRVTLRTYADVPWNAPFYARLGFVESEPDTAYLRDLAETEGRIGLDRWGRRLQMTATVNPPLRVRAIHADDESRWLELYAGYRAFYRLQEDAQAVATTWSWVRDGRHGLRGLVAVDETDRPVALANLRVFARPSTATLGLYLDDLFTATEARGSGAATALLRAAATIAAKEGASVVRWITASDNATARAVYDRVATATPWVTYDLAPAPGDDVRDPR
ncbi:GNAT family N-acetyltransferase [Amnibacterium setariae]|uniref:GNAT family N-acetyltransferase n=1 Tax=Amnibacterium setariae TaxID=2306585 RepID=UPI00268A0C99|nr:GNAT family N-acetyltransferase [Amnibacterium setariae]